VGCAGLLFAVEHGFLLKAATSKSAQVGVGVSISAMWLLESKNTRQKSKMEVLLNSRLHFHLGGVVHAAQQIVLLLATSCLWLLVLVLLALCKKQQGVDA